MKYATKLVLICADVCTLPLGMLSLVMENQAEISCFSVLLSVNHQEGNLCIADLTTEELLPA